MESDIVSNSSVHLEVRLNHICDLNEANRDFPNGSYTTVLREHSLGGSMDLGVNLCDIIFLISGL